MSEELPQGPDLGIAPGMLGGTKLARVNGVEAEGASTRDVRTRVVPDHERILRLSAQGPQGQEERRRGYWTEDLP